MAEIVRFQTPVFRASFPHLFKAQAPMEGSGEPKYSVSAVWTPADFTDREKQLWQKLMKAIDDECKSRFKKGLKELKALNAEGGNYKLVPRDGKAKADLEGYGEGTVFASLTTKMRPGVIDRDKNKIAPEEGNDDEIYAGCFCRATVTVYSYDNKGKGVALGLMNVQKVKDGDRLDSRTDAAEDFEDDIEDLDDGGDTSDFLDD